MPLLRASMNRRANRTSAWSLFRGRSEGCRKGSGVFLLPGILVATAFALAQAPNASKNNQATVKPNAVHFENIARQAGLTALNVNGNDNHNVFLIEGTGMGAVIFDYDNDGYLDLFVTYWGQNILYHNNGDGTFSEVSETAGLKTSKSEWSTGCSFLDYDRDGKVDLSVACSVAVSYDTVPRPGEGEWCRWKGIYVMCGPRGPKMSVNALYHNNGDGTFTDVSQASGITKASGCYGFTALSADFDNDGWSDVYVACDTTPNLLYHNNQDGTFSEIGKTAGVAYSEEGSMLAGMGASAGDYTHDGYQDIVKTNFSDDTPTVFLNRGNNTFDDVTRTAGLGRITTWLGWGVQFYDFDNSGWPGVLICNGHIYPELDGKNLGTSY